MRSYIFAVCVVSVLCFIIGCRHYNIATVHKPPSLQRNGEVMNLRFGVEFHGTTLKMPSQMVSNVECHYSFDETHYQVEPMLLDSETRKIVNFTCKIITPKQAGACRYFFTYTLNGEMSCDGSVDLPIRIELYPVQ